MNKKLRKTCTQIAINVHNGNKGKSELKKSLFIGM